MVACFWRMRALGCGGVGVLEFMLCLNVPPSGKPWFRTLKSSNGDLSELKKDYKFKPLGTKLWQRSLAPFILKHRQHWVTSGFTRQGQGSRVSAPRTQDSGFAASHCTQRLKKLLCYELLVRLQP